MTLNRASKNGGYRRGPVYFIHGEQRARRICVHQVQGTASTEGILFLLPFVKDPKEGVGEASENLPLPYSNT